jgi:hypothetical protein
MTNPIAAQEAPPASETNAEPNPFLMGAAADSYPRSPLSPTFGGAASRQPQAVEVVAAPPPRAQGAALRVDPAVSVPSLRDPHAAFRKGGWQKPLLLITVAAGALFALVTLVPKAEDDKLVDDQKKSRRAPIGGSVSPLIMEEPERDLSAKPAPAAPAAADPASAPSDTSSKTAFSESFKAQAK